ncbi:TraR/DksA C4-type zinc finger protein [Patescibacteria group bacterium]|nr:TraR/DksA C4-type zinc finger protein [Patescibacteria group bacterium]
MNKEVLKEIESKLKKQKKSFEEELGKFAKKDENLKGDWDTRFPKPTESSGSQALEDAADQVEKYVNLLPVEHNMELRLQDIDLALKKIKKGAYGKCEKCNKDIPIERLEIYPEARKCRSCK